MSILHHPRVGAFLLLALGTGGAARARAATFTIPNGDVGALKHAINLANANFEPDTILLATRGTYVLTQVDNVLNGPNGLPLVRSDSGSPLTLLGNGATLMRSSSAGTPSLRLLHTDYNSTLNVSGLTLRNGSVPGVSGGAIDNAGAMTLTNCILSGNASGQGGALVHSGSVLTLRRCVVSGNRAAFGGGITNFSRLNLIDSTISGNVATQSGGGIDNTYRATLNAQGSTFFGNRAAGGGALHNFGSTATLLQCTISGNVASGQGAGALNVGGSFNNAPLNATLVVRACTITLNRAPQAAGLGNLRNGARVVLNLRSSIVAGNMAGGLSSDLTNTDLLQDAGFNLIGSTPGLAPLANNGGPTLTHALLPGSRAINGGDTVPGTSYDQRGPGFVRARGGRADIGAFEVQPLSPSSGVL